jgi:hypothetical protein
MADVADMYPACLIGSRAVALMGVRTRFGLISGPVGKQPFGSSDLERGHCSVPCSAQSRTGRGVRLDRCHLVRVDAEGPLVPQDAPRDPCQLIG